MEQRCKALWQETPHPEQKERTVAELWTEVLPRLMAVPSPFDGFVEYAKRVSSTCLIAFERNRYSVPAAFANRPVSLRVYADRLVIVAEDLVVAEHLRVFSRDHSAAGITCYDWHHYLAVVQRKPGALLNGAPVLELPRSFKQLQLRLLKHVGGYREMADILALVLHHDEQQVEQAVNMALKSGQVSKQHVVNCLHPLMEGPRPAPLKSPAALRLVEEPRANTGRYDHLQR